MDATVHRLRRPRGAPVGGQFAPRSRSDPEITLSAPAVDLQPRGLTPAAALNLAHRIAEQLHRLPPAAEADDIAQAAALVLVSAGQLDEAAHPTPSMVRMAVSAAIGQIPTGHKKRFVAIDDPANRDKLTTAPADQALTDTGAEREAVELHDMYVMLDGTAAGAAGAFWEHVAEQWGAPPTRHEDLDRPEMLFARARVTAAGGIMAVLDRYASTGVVDEEVRAACVPFFGSPDVVAGMLYDVLETRRRWADHLWGALAFPATVTRRT